MAQAGSIEHPLETIVRPWAGYRFDLVLDYLRRSPSAITETIHASSYARAFRSDTGPVVARVTGVTPGTLRIEIAGPGASGLALDAIAARLWDALGLNRPHPEVATLHAQDRVAGELLALYAGLPPLCIPDLFETLVWAILGQQVNIAFAGRMKHALVRAYGEPVEAFGGSHHLFPSPPILARMTVSEARTLQISRQKAEYIRGIAESVTSGALDLRSLPSWDDETIVDRLTRLRGIGRWTAEYLLLRGLARPDAIPAGDMGQRAAIGRMYGLGRHASEQEVRTIAERWRPWRGIVAFYVWCALQRREVPTPQVLGDSAS